MTGSSTPVNQGTLRLTAGLWCSGRIMSRVAHRSIVANGTAMQPTDTEARLQEWGRWVRAGGVSLGASRVFEQGSTVPTPMIADDEALLIDRAVARLKRRDRFVGEVICLYYIEGGTEAAVGRRLRRSRTTIAGARKAGIAWIDGVLDERGARF